MEYCPHCMRPAAGEVCPYCGKPLRWTGKAGLELPVGTVLTGSNGLRTYQLGAALGKGGFGITYAALEVNSHRRMAIKEYFPSYCSFRAGNARDVQATTGQEQPYQMGLNSFLEEAKMLLSQDDLPTMVKVVDFFQANGTAYLVMEFIDGVPLHQKAAELGGRFPPKLLLSALPPLISDLGTLHSRGVIHRDISPDNILWTPDGSLKLIDFGSARATNNGGNMTMQMKQGFSPIEQYTRKGQGPWTDVYAMAATIYYCLTGVTPPASVERLEQDSLQPPTALGADLTPQEEQALLQAMAVQPGDRTHSMGEFAQELFREKQPVSPPPPPPPPPSPSIPWKKLAAIGGTSLAAVVALVIGVVLWFQNRPQPNTPVNPNPPAGTNGSQAAQMQLPTLPTLDVHLPTEAPTQPPETTENREDPVTDSDGFVYRIVDDQNASIIGYTGTDPLSSLPDQVNDIPITAIEDGAFAGAETDTWIMLPYDLKTIGANAFARCRGLRALVAYSYVRCEKDAFANSDIHVVFVSGASVSTSGWNLPDDVRLYQEGKDDGFGKWNSLIRNRSANIFYLSTEQDTAVVVLLSDTKDDIELPSSVKVDSASYEVVWIAEGADAGIQPGTTVKLPPNCRYDYSLSKSQGGGVAEFNALYDDTLADFWIDTCSFCDAINNARPRSAPAILPDLVLCDAVNILSQEEYNPKNGDRSNGQSWSTAIKEAGLQNWGYAKLFYGLSPTTSEIIEHAVERYAPAIDDPDASSVQGQYYARLGAARWYDYDNGSYFWEIILVVPKNVQ